jgi:methanethiol S-methyltransferase
VPSSPVVAAAERPWAWAGGILFAVSLGYFLFSYGFTFGEPATGPLRSTDALWNGALFTAFAFHHSLFARQPVRALVARLVPAALERSLYVAVASVLLILVCLWWKPLPGIIWNVTYPAGWLLHGLQAAGIGLILRSAAVINVRELSGLSPPATAGGPAEFSRSGPYGWVRHPIYTGWGLLVLPVPLMTVTRLEFAALGVLYILLAIPMEERTLRAGGKGYGGYAAEVRWRLIPKVY